MQFNYCQYFDRRQDVCESQLVVKGTRVSVCTRLVVWPKEPPLT